MVTHFPRNMKLYHPLLKQDSLYALLMISNEDTLHDNSTDITHATPFLTQMPSVFSTNWFVR